MTGRWTCEECGERFDRDRSGGRVIRFCGQTCYHAWNRREGSGAGRIQKGSPPWNKGLRGTHFSPATEFRPGTKPENWLPVGAVTFRQHDGDSVRAWVKVAEPRNWRMRAVVVWETANGRPVPRGSVIHHHDRDSLNDALGNLVCLTRAQHLDEHRAEYLAAKADRVAA